MCSIWPIMLYQNFLKAILRLSALNLIIVNAMHVYCKNSIKKIIIGEDILNQLKFSLLI